MSTVRPGAVRSGIRLTLLSTMLSGVIQATTMVVLARLLGPTDYGFYVVALAVNAIAGQFVASAIERAMVIERDAAVLLGRAIPVALVLAAVNALVFAVAAVVRIATGWQLEPGVLAVVLAGQAIGGLSTVPRAILRREIRFGPIVTAEIAALLIGNLATAALLARIGYGAYALAIGYLVATITVAAILLAIRPRAIARPRWTGTGDLPGLVLGVVRPAVLESINGQVSPLVVSSVLGAVSLGLFNRVYNLVTLPVQLLVSSLNRILMSTLVAVADRPDLCRERVRLMLGAASALIAPVALGLAASGSAFVTTILGPRWLAAAPIVAPLAIAVWANMLASIVGQLADAVRRFDDKVRIQAISTALLVAFLVLGRFWDIVGVAVGYMTASLIFAGLYLRLAAAIVERPVGTVVGWMVPGIVAGVGCWAVASGIGVVLSGQGPALILSAQIGACGLVAVVFLYLTDRTLLAALVGLILPTAIGDRLRRPVSG